MIYDFFICCRSGETQFSQCNNIAEPDLGWNVGLTPFPHPASNAPSVQASVTPTLIVASLIFNVVVLLQSVVRSLLASALRI